MMNYMCGKIGEEQTCLERNSFSTFSTDGKSWSPQHKIAKTNEWLWEVTWYQGRAYSISYNCSDKEKWSTTLWRSADGVHFNPIQDLEVSSFPSESVIRFLPNGKMMILIRRGKAAEANAWIGVSSPPYTTTTWQDCGIHFSGPNFLILPNGSIWAAGRAIEEETCSTVVASMNPSSLKKVLTLPSGGDTSYPGMVFHENKLWISYYSSHEEEGKSAIYLATVVFD